MTVDAEEGRLRERHIIRQHYEALEQGKTTPEALDRRFREHALEICPVCDGEVAVRIGIQGPGGTDLAHEPMTRAKAYEANALRAGGDLKAADKQMATALANVGKLERPEAQAEIVSLAASLRRGQRRLEEALRLVDLAIQLDSEAGDEHQVAKRLFLKGTILFQIGRREEAIGAVKQALERVDPQRDLLLYVAAEHTLLCYLADAGYVTEARKRFEEAQDHYDCLEGEWSLQVRRRWLEGNIARGFGETEQAERSLTAVRDSFLERGNGFDAALVSLDLARLYEDQGRLDKLQEQAEAALPIFRSLDLHREAAAALALLVKGASRAPTPLPSAFPRPTRT
jgi:tetratricopeptide (TPR) repeat protein